MKNFKIIFLLIFFIQANILVSQEIVSTEPQLRNAVLEEFTGIHCGNCPGGHEKAKELSRTNPGRVVLIAIHEGYYAVPNTGEPDFRTQWGSAILEQTKLSGFPAGTINRLRFPGSDYSFPYNTQMAGGMAMGPNGWEPAAVDSVLNGEYSPVNIATKTKWNNETRELEIFVELYFTDDVPEGVKLNIALLENHVWGPQTGATNPQHYEHNFILRDLITGQWGEPITTSSKGNLYSNTFNYTVNNNYNILNCELAFFVSRVNNEEIFTGISQEVIPPTISAFNLDGRIVNTLSNSLKSVNYELKNNSDNLITYEISIEKSARTPLSWNAVFQNDVKELTLDSKSNINTALNITTDDKKGIGDFIIKFSEKNNPVSNPLYDTVTILTTDIDYLEVDAGGNNLNTLSSARNNFVSFPLTTFNQISDRLNNIKILVWNFGPKGRLNENDANTIDSLFLSGIGIVMNGSGALPTLKIENPNHSFFSTFGIDWSDNNQIELESFGLTGVPDDPITSTFNAPGLSFAKNGYLMQSVNIINTETAFPIIKMIENNKVISARIIGDVAKSVYLGFNIDIIEDINLKENLIKKIIDWIEGTVDVEETTQTPGEVNLSVINNDKEGTIIVNIEEFRKTIPIAEILIVDITGSCIKKLYSGQSNNRKTSYQFNINEFANGFYLVVLKYNNTVKSVPFINFK